MFETKKIYVKLLLVLFILSLFVASLFDKNMIDYFYLGFILILIFKNVIESFVK